VANDLDAGLAGWRDECAPAWRPKPGERCVGTVLKYSLVETDCGESWVATTVPQDREARGLWLSQTEMRSAFVKPRPRLASAQGSGGWRIGTSARDT
jgi:hypothetical protein